MRGLIESRKTIFFVNIKPETYPLVTEIIMQICVLPRVLLSPTDATFCTQFFFHLHSIDTPGLSTLSFLDKVLKTVTPLIFCTTEYEAGFIGFLLHNLLITTNSWVNSEKVYEKEGKSHIGFILNFDLPPSSESNTNYSQFQHIYSTWHSTIKKIILACLNSSEYMVLIDKKYS
jgi:THO complex subunit 2